MAPASRDDAVPGGLGLLLVRTPSTSAGYERREGRNRLSIAVSRG